MGFKARRHIGAAPRMKEFDLAHPDAAGIDIGAREIWVSVREDRAEPSIRRFATLTTGLHELAAWLEACAVDTVAMESTGVYWIPLYEILQERGIDVHLVNAHHVKSVPGRKSDVLDCQWLRQLHRFGLLRRSFRPSAEIVELRAYLRQRDTLVRAASSEICRMQKALTLMNLQIHNVLSDITGKTGMAILRAITAGERDPAVLATHRDPRCRASQALIEASLTGNYQPAHLFALRQAMALYDLHQQLIAECDQAVAQRLEALTRTSTVERPPLPARRGRRSSVKHAVDFRAPLYHLAGVDLTAVPGLNDGTVASLLGEIGVDMTAWPNARAFASWLRFCPRTDITGGTPKSRRTLPTSSRASQLLRMAAMTAGRTDTALGAFYRRLAVRKPPGVAVVATANKLARIIYTMLAQGTEFHDIGPDAYDARQRQRAIRSLQKRATALGVTVVVEPAA